MERAPSAVVYDGLPISSGGAHGLGRVSATRALERWQGFLTARTEPSPALCSFDVSGGPSLWGQRRALAQIRRAFPSEGGHRTHVSVPPERLDEAVSLLESLEPQPTTRWGEAAVSLSASVSFQLLSPFGPGPWPGQDLARFGHFQTPAGPLGASSTRLILDARRSMTVQLTIPDASDGDLAVVVPWLQEALPVRLSASHWTRWTLTKDGRSYRATKITPPSAGCVSAGLVDDQQ